MLKINATHVCVGRNYKSSPSTVWRIITDTRKWPQWGPTVRKVQSSDRFIRRGSKGRVQTSVGIWLPFEITEYEDGRYWTWKIGSVKATGHRVQARELFGSTLWFDVPIPVAPYGWICQVALKRIERLLCDINGE